MSEKGNVHLSMRKKSMHTRLMNEAMNGWCINDELVHLNSRMNGFSVCYRTENGNSFGEVFLAFFGVGWCVCVGGGAAQGTLFCDLHSTGISEWWTTMIAVSGCSWSVLTPAGHFA